MTWLAAHWLPLLAVVAIPGALTGLAIVRWTGRHDRREERRRAAEARAAHERDDCGLSWEERATFAELAQMARPDAESATDADRP